MPFASTHFPFHFIQGSNLLGGLQISSRAFACWLLFFFCHLLLRRVLPGMNRIVLLVVLVCYCCSDIPPPAHIHVNPFTLTSTFVLVLKNYVLEYIIFDTRNESHVINFVVWPKNQNIISLTFIYLHTLLFLLLPLFSCFCLFFSCYYLFLYTSHEKVVKQNMRC